MTTLLALYRGNSVADARVVAVSADPDLVAYVAERLLSPSGRSEDPVVGILEDARRSALHEIRREAECENPTSERFRIVGSRGDGGVDSGPENKRKPDST